MTSTYTISIKKHGGKLNWVLTSIIVLEWRVPVLMVVFLFMGVRIIVSMLMRGSV